jgi:hypothetical protein
MAKITCNRKLLSDFISNNMEEESRLEFLLHLDDCPYCWEQLYSATKAQHPQFYKSPPRKKANLEEEDLGFEKNSTDSEEEVFEVA